MWVHTHAISILASPTVIHAAQSLRESILQAVRPAEESSDDESLRRELPTPAQHRSTAYQRDRDSPTNMVSSMCVCVCVCVNRVLAVLAAPALALLTGY